MKAKSKFKFKSDSKPQSNSQPRFGSKSKSKQESKFETESPTYYPFPYLFVILIFGKLNGFIYRVNLTFLIKLFLLKVSKGFGLKIKVEKISFQKASDF